MISILEHISVFIMIIAFIFFIQKLIPTKYERMNPRIKYLDNSLIVKAIMNKKKE